MRRILALTVLPWLAACGDLDVRSVRTAPAVPSALLGEWVGTWDSGAATGSVAVLVQEFENEPVVRIEFQNPCFEPRVYDLIVDESRIELRADGATVMTGTIGADRTMAGSYQCASQSGVWSTSWRRELPVPVDLTGVWSGTVLASGQPELPFDLHLEQGVEAGAIVLVGLMDLGPLWPALVPVQGNVLFREPGFELLLRTPDGTTPSLRLAGVGDLGLLRVENGLVQVLGEPVLPFTSGVFHLLRRGD